ncbi:hypothetical protein [Micromonospora chalcea]|uniref:hypothetical protein n=1 Tax=Micromonospora chalcea TaxID=1874 RepID=UPI00332839A7
MKLEAWGDGFYFSSNTDPNSRDPWREWGAQRWVKSGTNVCAASTDKSGRRDIACITIKV